MNTVTVKPAEVIYLSNQHVCTNGGGFVFSHSEEIYLYLFTLPVCHFHRVSSEIVKAVGDVGSDSDGCKKLWACHSSEAAEAQWPNMTGTIKVICLMWAVGWINWSKHILALVALSWVWSWCAVKFPIQTSSHFSSSKKKKSLSEFGVVDVNAKVRIFSSVLFGLIFLWSKLLLEEYFFSPSAQEVDSS